MKVYLDDERKTPDGWVRTYTPEETIELLKTGNVEYLSLDHDLGYKKPTGYEVVLWMEEQVFVHKNYTVIPKYTDVHSQNPEGVRRMRNGLRSLYEEMWKNE